jgi:hypothetical protein
MAKQEKRKPKKKRENTAAHRHGTNITISTSVFKRDDGPNREKQKIKRWKTKVEIASGHSRRARTYWGKWERRRERGREGGGGR